MKSFVVVALLVASVAAQNMDIMSQLNKEKSLFKSTHLVEDLLMKENLKDLFLQGQEMPTWGHHQVSKLTLEEMVQTTLFSEYYNIPLFRQFWEQYPMVFHKYVQSVLFQQFWTIPAFQQYFRNPVLFYKYIVPQVQVVAQQYRHGDMYTNTNTMDMNMYTNKFDTVDQMINNKYTNKFDTVDQMINNKYNLPYGYQYNKDWTVPMTRGLEYPTQSIFGQKNMNVNYKFLLDKIYKELNFGKVGGITETMTDVRAFPTGRIEEHTFGKIIDPITGEEKVTVGDVKLVDEKIVPVQTLDFPVEHKMNTIVESEMMKEALLKKFFLNKIFGGKNVYPEMMTKGFNKYEYEPMMLNKYNKFNTQYDVSAEDIMSTMNMNTNKYMSPIVSRMYSGLNKINKINKFPFGIYNNQVNKMDLINEYQTEKMIKNFETEKMIKDFQTEKMIKDFQTEKMINGQVYPFMTKENMFNKFNKFNVEKTMDMEIPTMMTEKYHHIPLTFGKPIVGSGLNEFQIEKELKELNKNIQY